MSEFSLRYAPRYGFEEALEKVPEALKSEGFGVLTNIDIGAILKEKLGVPFRRYRILGACNPPLAFAALQAEIEIGLLLPCNVIIYEDDLGQVIVGAIDPMLTIASLGNEALQKVALTVREKLSRALAGLES